MNGTPDRIAQCLEPLRRGVRTDRAWSAFLHPLRFFDKHLLQADVKRVVFVVAHYITVDEDVRLRTLLYPTPKRTLGSL